MSMRFNFLKDERGLSTIEFALILPVMVILFFGIVEGSSAYRALRNADLATETLSDLVAQEITIDANELGDLFTGVEQIIGNEAVNINLRVISLIIDPNTNAVAVDWSLDNKGNTPYSKGSAYTKIASENFLDSGASVIVAEIDYDFVPVISQFYISPVNLENFSFRWPRRTNKVVLE